MTIKARKVCIIFLVLAFILAFMASLIIPQNYWIWILIMLVVSLVANCIGDIDREKGRSFRTSKWYRTVVVFVFILSIVIAYNVDLPNHIVYIPFYSLMFIDIIIYTTRIFRYERNA